MTEPEMARYEKVVSAEIGYVHKNLTLSSSIRQECGLLANFIASLI